MSTHILCPFWPEKGRPVYNQGAMSKPEASAFSTIRHAKKRAFLAAYARLGTILAASEASNICRDNHALWMKKDPAYAEAFEAAKDMSIEMLEHEARRRAYQGVDDPVFYQGVEVAKVRKYSDTLLMFLLNGLRPERYKWRGEVSGPNGGPISLQVIDQIIGKHDGKKDGSDG